jgi:hypothetical protein
MPSTQLTTECPRCHTSLKSTSTSCACGHQFDDTIDLVTQAEVLYETHLRARLQRTKRLARVAKVDLLRDPISAAKKAQSRELESQVRSLQEKLDAQNDVIAQARAAVLENAQTVLTTISSIDALRANESVKAAQSMELNRLQAALNELSSAQPSQAFTETQTRKADHVAQKMEKAQACPKCGSPTTIAAVRCNCGFRFDLARLESGLSELQEVLASRDNV